MNKSANQPQAFWQAVPWLSLWLLAAGLFAGNVLLLHRHEGRRDVARTENWEEAWRNRLPLVQQRFSKVHLTEELLIGSTTGISSLGPLDVQRIRARLLRRFGKGVRFVIIESDGRILSASGFSPPITRIIGRILQTSITLEGLDMLGNITRPMAIGDFNHSFSNHEAWNVRMDNWTDISPVRFGNESGMALFSLLPDSHRFDFSRRKWKLVPQGEPGPLEKQTFTGGLFAFIPWNSLDRVWVKRSLSRYPGIERCRVRMGSPERLLSRSGLPLELQGDLRQAIDSRRTGVVCRNGWITAFFRPPFSPESIVLISRPLPPSRAPNRLAAGLVASVSILLLLAAALTVAFRSTSGGTPSLSGKFLFLLLLAIAIPTLSLVRITMTLREESRLLAQAGAFKELEERLQAVETRHLISLSDYCAELKRFLAWTDRGRTPPRTLDIKDWLAAHPNLRFNLAYFSHRQAPQPRFIEQTQAHQSGFLIPLMNQISRAAGFYPDSHGKGVSGKEATEDMILDIAQSLIGSDDLFRTFNRLDEIVTFRFYFDVGWVYLHIMPPKDGKFGRLAFFTLDLDDSQEHSAFSLVREQPASQPPPLTLAPRSRHQNLYFPDRASRISIIRRAIARCLDGGGVQKASFRWQGRPHILIARPMRNLDMIGVAVRPAPAPLRLDPASIITVGYPLLIGILVLHLFGHYYLRPIALLHQGVDGIAGGDYSQRVPIMTDDEIGSLCQGFNTMAEGLAEKEYLRRFLSDLAMSAVRSGSEGQAATRASAAVLFSDIRGFTTLSEKHPPEAIVTMLNRYFTAMEEAIEAQGGSIEKFIGDAIMATFLPMHGRPHPALRAVKAAIQMREALATFNRDRSSTNLFEIATGIGIASGDILLGALGRPDGRRDFTVTGPTVNLASAMEKRSKEGVHTRIILCPQTSRHLASRRLAPLPPVEIGPAWELIS